MQVGPVPTQGVEVDGGLGVVVVVSGSGISVDDTGGFPVPHSVHVLLDHSQRFKSLSHESGVSVKLAAH